MIQCCVVWAYCVVRSYFCWWLSLVVWVCGMMDCVAQALDKPFEHPAACLLLLIRSHIYIDDVVRVEFMRYGWLRLWAGVR